MLVQAEHLEPGAIQRKCYPLPGCRSWDRNCWYIKGQVCGAENVDKQQDTAIEEGVGGTGISVMGTPGHNASHLSICLQEACFFHQNALWKSSRVQGPEEQN